MKKMLLLLTVLIFAAGCTTTTTDTAVSSPAATTDSATTMAICPTGCVAMHCPPPSGPNACCKKVNGVYQVCTL